MGDIIEEMSNKMPEGFFGFYILLPANMAITAHHSGSAIQAIFLTTFPGVAHNKFLLK